MIRHPARLPFLSGAAFGLLVLAAWCAGAYAQGQPTDLSGFLPPGFGADDTTPIDLARYSGALWLAAAVFGVAGAQWVRARLKPSATHVEFTGLRGRAYTLLGVAVAIGAAIVDKLGNDTGWQSVATAAVVAIGVAFRAPVDVPKGNKLAPTPAPVTEPIAAVAGEVRS